MVPRGGLASLQSSLWPPGALGNPALQRSPLPPLPGAAGSPAPSGLPPMSCPPSPLPGSAIPPAVFVHFSPLHLPPLTPDGSSLTASTTCPPAPRTQPPGQQLRSFLSRLAALAPGAVLGPRPEPDACGMDGGLQARGGATTSQARLVSRRPGLRPRDRCSAGRPCSLCLRGPGGPGAGPPAA